MNNPGRIAIRVLLFLLPIAHIADAGTPARIVQRAFRLQSGAFSEAYVQHAFAQWLKATDARLTEAVETYRTKQKERTEIWVEGLDVPEGSYDLSFELTEDGRIADVRRLLIRQRAALSNVDEAVFRFVERFVWVYDTASATLLRDFLYPSYVTLQYGGHSSTEESVGQLRKDFPAPLWVISVSWERSDLSAIVSLSPGPVSEPKTPVTLKVDIPQYIAARGPDAYEKGDALRDSLVHWSKRPPYGISRSQRERRTIEISSEEEMMITLQEEMFRGYRLSLLDRTQHVIEASLPPFHGNIPATLRYRLSIVDINTRTVRLQPRVEMNVQMSDSLVRWYGGEVLPKPKVSIADSTLAALLRKNVHRYRSLSLPVAFRPVLRTAPSFRARLTVYHKEDYTSTFSDPSSWNNVLSKLSEDTFAYYVPRSIEMDPEGIWITGYAVWKKRSEAWHHFAKVREVFVLHSDGVPSVAQVRVDLYPFIRTDYLANLFTTMKRSRPIKQRFPIHIRP